MSWRRQPLASLVTAPAVEPLSLSECKLYLRVDHTSDDTLIAAMLVSARTWAETFLRRALCTQTIDYRYRGWPVQYGPLVVPGAPLQSVTSITYVDQDEATQTLAASQYVVRTQAGPRAGRGTIEIADGVTFPSLSTQPDYPVTVRAVCGYGSAPQVPDGIKAGIYLLLGDLYEQRQETITGTISAKSQLTVERLLSPYRLIEAV
jgi:uncharacterized phiE125 gp8 family phage protein